MIDIHSHLLPGVDDGARNRDESLAMLRIAAADGIRTIVATPHYRTIDPGLPMIAGAALRVVRKHVEQEGLPIQVLGGFELSITPKLSERSDELRGLGLNGSRYLLVEGPEQFWPAYVEAELFGLQASGLRPILAHVERYHALNDDIERAVTLARRDILLQVNASSLTGCNGWRQEQLARELVRRGIVSFIASDSHSQRSRTPLIHRGARAAARLIGNEAAEALVGGNPHAALSDYELPAPPPIRRYRFFSIAPRKRMIRADSRLIPEHPALLRKAVFGSESGG